MAGKVVTRQANSTFFCRFFVKNLGQLKLFPKFDRLFALRPGQFWGRAEKVIG
jgi:hypothetical protein